jgi:tRNA threonylcarbamoyladenosine biosynthesis protein TsaB
VRVLALETSGRVGSIAVLECAGSYVETCRERTLPDDQRSARSLLPCVEQLLADVSWRPGNVELVCTTIGPGSFTGLRIGVVAAKTFAYATGAKLVGVHTLTALAKGCQTDGPRLWTVLDAQRQELFVAAFDTRRPLVDQVDPVTEILRVDAWLAQLAPGDAVAGPPVAKLRERLPEGVMACEAELWSPAARDVGALAAALFERGAAVDPLSLVPRYYRKSAAEEKFSPRSLTGG